MVVAIADLLTAMVAHVGVVVEFEPEGTEVALFNFVAAFVSKGSQDAPISSKLVVYSAHHSVAVAQALIVPRRAASVVAKLLINPT